MAYTLNIDNTYIDGAGNELVLSNNVRATAYYDATAENSWTKNFFNAADFSALTNSGTLYGPWTDSSSSAVAGNFSVCPNYSVLNRDGDLIRKYTEATSESSYYNWYYRAESLIKWVSYYDDSLEAEDTQDTYPWTTDTTESGNAAWAKFDMAEPREFDSVYLKWSGTQGPWYLSKVATTANSPKDYSVEASNDDITYYTIISGTITEQGEVVPEYFDTGAVSYRYVKVNIFNNWGGPETGLSEFGVFKKPAPVAVMLYPNDFDETVATDYAELSASLDLSSINRIYTTVGGYFYEDLPECCFRVLVDSDVIFDSQDPAQPVGRNVFWSAGVVSVDTSDYTGAHMIRFRFRGPDSASYSSRPFSYAWVSRCSIFPSWYDEGVSDTRGSRAYFPDKAVVVSDSTSLSIIDVSSTDSSTGLPTAPLLWMRFLCGPGRAIQVAPSAISCCNGKIFLTTSVALYIVDFSNDCIDKYTTSGLYRLGGISNRNSVVDTSVRSNDVYGVAPQWVTISEEAGSKLRDSALECLSVVKDVQSVGDDFVVVGGLSGAEAVVSGTVYSSKFRNRISAISTTANGEVAFAGGSDGFGRVGVMYDFSGVGVDDFDVDYLLHQDNDDFYEAFNGTYDSDALVINSGKQLSITTSGTYATLSGTVAYIDQKDQRAVILLSKGAADRPFKATAFVRLRQWPDASPGELRFGVFNKEPAASINSDISDARGVYMSARNSIAPPGPVYSDSFLDGVVNFYNISRGTDVSIWTYDPNIPTQYGLGAGAAGAGAYYPVSLASFNSVYDNSFILRFKLLPYHFHRAPDPADYAVFRVGLANDIGYYHTPTSKLYFEVGMDNTYTQGVYRVASYSSSTWSYSDTNIPFFAEDNASEASLWRDVVIFYNKTSMSMDVYVDGFFVGTKDIPFWDGVVSYLTISGDTYNGSSTSSAVALVKEFSIDFPDYDYSQGNRKYAVCTKSTASLGADTAGFCYSEYLWGSAESPYLAKTTTSFSGTEGTAEEPFRKWELFYNPEHSSISAYIDGVHIGSSNLDYSDSKMVDMSIGFDAQFWPPVTISGGDFLEVHIRDFSVTYSGTEDNFLYEDSAVFSPVMPGILYDADVSSVTGIPVDINVVVGTSTGISKISTNKPDYLLEHRFDGAAVPVGWVTKDMPGAAGSSSWTVASGVLKQSGPILGHGGMGSPDSAFAPYGTHLLTDISCLRENIGDYAVGKTVSARLRTTGSGCVGIGFNEQWSTEGTVTTGSGMYCAWFNNNINHGKFESTYDSDGPVYSYSYTIDGFARISESDIADIGIPRSVSIKFTSVSGVDIYVDSSKVFEAYNPIGGYQDGCLSFLCNNNTNLDVFDCVVYGSDTTAHSVTTYAVPAEVSDYGVLLGIAPSVVSVTQDYDFSRSSGLVHAASSSQSYRWTRLQNQKNIIYTDSTDSVLSSFFYDKENDRLLGASCSISTIEGPTKNLYTYPVQYDFSTNVWRFAGELSAALAIPRTISHYTYGIWPSIYFIRTVDGSAGYGGMVQITYCDHNHSVYLLSGQLALAKYDSSTKETVLWGDGLDNYVDGTPNKEAGALGAKSFSNRWDGFSYFNGGGSGHSELFGTPTFSWYDGFVYLTRTFVTQGGQKLGEAFFILDPASGNWTLDFSGAMSLDGILVHNPPVGDAEEEVTFYTYSNQDFVYNETNDSIYSIRHNKMYRLDLPTNRWVLLEDPPFAIDTSITEKAVKMASVPELNSLFVMNGTDGVLYVYDIASDTWELRLPVPGGTSSHSHMLYVPEKSKLFSYISGTNEFLELSFNITQGVFYDTTAADANVLPQDSKYGMFSWRGVDSCVVNEPFDYSELDFGHWFTTSSGWGPDTIPSAFPYGGYVSSSADDSQATRVSCVTEYSAYSAIGGVSSRKAIKASSFTATLDVRNPQIENTGYEVYTVFGVGQGSINTGSSSAYTTSPARLYSRGQNGVYACAFDTAEYPYRYSLVKRDGSSISSLVATDFLLAESEDQSWDAPFRTWSITYDAEAASLALSVDGSYVGVETLVSKPAEVFIEIGVLSELGRAEYTTMEFKNFTVDFNMGYSETEIHPSSKALVINKRQEYNDDYYYERTLSALSPEASFVYDTRLLITFADTTDCPYVLSIGRLRDGNKEINVCALVDAGVKKIGIWNGNDPWDMSSGYDSAVEFDWYVDTQYRVVKDAGASLVSVYADSMDVPIITKSYGSFPNVYHSYNRSVAFGNIGLASGPTEVIDASFHEGVGSVISGTSWTRVEQDYTPDHAYTAHSWFGSAVYATTASGNTDDYIEWVPTVASGITYLYYCPGRNVSTNSTNAPYTIYHTGSAVDVPAYDGYATNNITSVYENTTHSGTALVGATTINLCDNRLANGRADVNLVFPGLVYLGTYTDISSVVATRDASDGTYVYPGTMFFYSFDRNARLKSISTSHWYYVKCEPGVTAFTTRASELSGGVNIIDISTNSVLDYYSVITDPAIAGENMSDVSKM